MIDPDLERRYADCVELMDAWKSFLEIINKGVKTPETITPQAEENFLAAKARIAMLHDSFTASLKHDKKTGQTMIDLVNRSITLRLMSKGHDAEHKKMEIEWHEVFLLLNETVSGLNEERETLANRNELLWKLGKLQTRMATSLKAFLKSWYFKWGCALLAVIFVIVGIPALGIYDYDKLRDESWSKKPVGQIFWVFREMGNFPAPYIDLAQLSDKINKLELRDLTREVHSMGKEGGIAAIKGKMLVGLGFTDQDALGDALAKSQEFAAWRVNRPGSQGFVYAFWFRNTKDASNFQRDWISGRNMAADFQAVRKANVILIAWVPGNTGDNNVNREAIRDQILKKVAPT